MTAILIVAGLLQLWTLFLSYTALKAKWSNLRLEVKIVGFIFVLSGLLLDIAINWTIGLVLGITKDFTLSQKCKRLGKLDSLRGKIARYICKNWLNPFDQGHC